MFFLKITQNTIKTVTISNETDTLQMLMYKKVEYKFQNKVQLIKKNTSYFKKFTKTDQYHKLNMKQTFVNNIEQLMTANQNQRIKINYLESQKQKREQYLSGLRQSIMLNKQTLIVLNQQGPNNQAIDAASKENHHLIKLNQSLYTENRQLNALLLMEQQLRVQDKAFYLERISQFENRISQLRKYLHDKEESFSAVVGRLKKYQEWNQKPLGQKIQDTQGLRRVTSEILSQVMTEKNMFKAKFQEVFPDAQRFKILTDALNNRKNLSRFINQCSNFQQKPKTFSQTSSPRQQLLAFHMINNIKPVPKEQKPIAQFKQTQLTKQLMRLLKKQKLNNQILQNALHSAIQKNQELLKINQNLQMTLQIAEKKTEKLIAQNYFYKLKIKQFSYGYGKKYIMAKVKQVSDQPGFQSLFKLNFQIKDQDNDEVSKTIYKDLMKQSLKEDIQRLLKIPLTFSKPCQLKNQSNLSQQERITQMTTNDNTRLNQKIVKSKITGKIETQKQIKQKNISTNKRHQKMMIKSSSQPRFVIEWDNDGYQCDDDHEMEQMVVEQF